MATVTATSPKAPPKSKLDEEWFARLRAALKKGVLSSNPTTALQEHYKKAEKHLSQIEGYGFKTDEYRAEYDKIVAQVLKAADDKSESAIKKADKALSEFDAKLKKAKDNIKDVVKNCKWEASRGAALKCKQEYEESWGRADQVAAFDKKYREVVQLGFSANPKDPKQKQEAVATQADNGFKGLAVEIQKAIDTAKSAKQSWETAQAAAEKAFSVYQSDGSAPDPSEYLKKQELFRTALDKARERALTDHNFAEAESNCKSIKENLLKVLQDGLTPKRDYQKLEQEVAAKLADIKEKVSQAIYNGLDFKYQAARVAASATPPGYAKATQLLTDLSTAIADRGKAAEEAQQQWQGNADRKWIRERYEKVQEECLAKDEQSKNDPNAVKCVPSMNAVGLGGLVQRLTAIEDTATATGDMERAVADTATLRKTFEERVALLFKSIENAQKSGAECGKHKAAADQVAKKLDALTKLMNDKAVAGSEVAPKQLQDRFAKYGVLPQIADPAKFAPMLETYTAELEKISVEAQALLDDSGKRDAYKQGEVNAAAVAKHRAAYEKLLPAVERLMVQLADICEPAKEPYAKRKIALDAAAKDAKATDPKTVEKAAAAMQSLATELPKDMLLSEKAVKESREKLVKAVEAFNKEFSRLDSLLAKLPGVDGDPCQGYRKNLQDTVKKIEATKATQDPAMLESGLKKVEECSKKLLATEDPKSGPKSAVRVELVKRADRLKLLKKRLEVKQVGKNCKTRQTELMARYTRLQELLNGNTDPEKDAELKKLDANITELDDQAVELAKEAALISQKRKSLKKTCSKLDKQFKDLATAMKALKKTPEFAKVDIPGEDFGELGKERKRIDTLASGEDLAKYTQAEEIAVKLETKLAEALKNPAEPVRGEQKAIADKKKAEEELAKKKEKWEWDFNSFINGEYKQAKESQDKKTLENLQAYKKEAEELGDKKDYDGAQKRLVLLRQLAEVQINSPPGGLTSKTLKPLQHQWQTTVKKFTADLKALEKAIVDECQGQNLAKPTPAEIEKLGKNIAKIAKTFDPQAFDPFVAILTDKNITEKLQRRTARERGLDMVREYQRAFTGDPLMNLVIRNPFHRVLSGNVLWETLNRLDLGFQISV
jgi:hypothetical protein